MHKPLKLPLNGAKCHIHPSIDKWRTSNFPKCMHNLLEYESQEIRSRVIEMLLVVVPRQHPLGHMISKHWNSS